MTHNGFRCLDPLTNQVFISRHAVFDETTYPYKTNICSSPLSPNKLSSFFDPHEATLPAKHNQSRVLCRPCLTDLSSSAVPTSILQDIDTLTPPADQTQPPAANAQLPAVQAQPPANQDQQPANQAPPTSAGILGSHPMQTRSKSGIFRHSHRVLHTCTAPNTALIQALLTMREPK